MSPLNQLNSSLGNVASAIEELYNNGRVVSSDEKLVYKDFLQLCYFYLGDVASIQYYKELRAGNQSFYFSQLIESTEVPINPAAKGKAAYIELHSYLLLPYMSGILAIYPKTDASYRDPDDDFIKMQPGHEGLYAKPRIIDDLGLKFWVPKGDRLELFGCAEGPVIVEYMPVGEETEVTQQMASILITIIMKEILPGKVLPTDTHEDTDPNQATYKQRLDQPQSI